MGLPQSPSTITGSSTHMYPQALQVKLYQAFIFSIPILFSIILFLLFYLFYLKRRSSLPLPPPPPPPVLPRTFSDASSFIASPCEMGLKAELQENLPKVVFDENLRERDSVCCVCLGEFEMKEELVQMPSCKHLFHVECIHHWLQSNTTCPLCRCSVVAADHHHTKLLIASHHHHHHHQINNNHQHHHQQLVVSSVASTIQVEEAPSTSNTTSRVVSHENEMDHQPPFALHIHVQNS